MEFLELANARQSVRKYATKKVDKEIIEKCIEAARIAPSACNSQPWKFIIVDEPELKNKIAKATFELFTSFNKFTLTAPVLVVLVAMKPKTIAQIGGRIKNKDFYLFDIGITAEHFCLQAAEMGIGTCMLGWFREKEIKKLLQIPDSRSVALVISIGYAEDEPLRKKIRKPITEIMAYNKF